MKDKDENTAVLPKKGLPVKWLALIAAAVILCLLAAAGVLLLGHGQEEPSREVVTISTLEKIIKTSELSTYTSVYNGVVTVTNADDPEEVDYYVAYEATVDAGIDFQDCTIAVDEATHTITVTLPKAYITNVSVDAGSLDYIFVNKKAETSTVSAQALTLCKQDAQTESEKQEALLSFAEKNAENVITALTRPLLEQGETGYTLAFQTA